MNVAVVVFSETGKTLKLAELAREKLLADGHSVQLTRLQTDPVFDSKHNLPEDQIKFTNLPDLGSASVLIFGTPVWAFRPCAAGRKALRDLGPQLKGKSVLPFITHGFPWAWLTGTSSANALRRLAADFGAKALAGVVLSGSMKKGEERYQAAAEKIRNLLK